jgi:hypothetical protein
VGITWSPLTLTDVQCFSDDNRIDQYSAYHFYVVPVSKRIWTLIIITRIDREYYVRKGRAAAAVAMFDSESRTFHSGTQLFRVQNIWYVSY